MGFKYSHFLLIFVGRVKHPGGAIPKIMVHSFTLDVKVIVK
jgi:hypothetical protein